MTMLLRIAMLVALPCMAVSANADQKLDCGQPASRTQAAICNNAPLRALDMEVRAIVEALRTVSSQSEREQQRITRRYANWQASLDTRCRDRLPCLEQAYRQGVERAKRELRQLERRSASGPDKQGSHDSKDKGTVVARFFASDRWSYTGADAAAEVRTFLDGSASLRVEVVSQSGAFKYFAEPHAVLVVTDATGRVLGDASVSGLAMRMGTSGVFEKRDGRTSKLKRDLVRSAAYAFFRFKFCGWRQTFERTVGENNGCHQSDLRREYNAFVADLPKSLSQLAVAPGEQFPILGWTGMRLP